MIQALEAHRRSASQTSPAIAARSPEPAKRCEVPHSFSACAAGTRWASMVSITSMAADSLAAGVIGRAFACGRSKHHGKRRDRSNRYWRSAGQTAPSYQNAALRNRKVWPSCAKLGLAVWLLLHRDPLALANRARALLPTG